MNCEVDEPGFCDINSAVSSSIQGSMPASRSGIACGTERRNILDNRGRLKKDPMLKDFRGLNQRVKVHDSSSFFFKLLLSTVDTDELATWNRSPSPRSP